jgi:hypothetical protein
MPVGAEGQRTYSSSAAGQGLAERPGLRGIGDIPQPDRTVQAAAGQQAAMEAERQ